MCVFFIKKYVYYTPDGKFFTLAFVKFTSKIGPMSKI